MTWDRVHQRGGGGKKSAHKYLGRHICGHSQNRGETELNHRIAQAWGKFHKHRQTLNRNVPIGLRLKLFDSTVTPT